MICKEIDEYIKYVRCEKYKVCKEQKLLVQYIDDCFKNEEIYVDIEQLEKYLSLQKYFDYELFPWEKFCFALHNCVYSQPGILRWPDLTIIVGRGAGKNGYLAFEDFALITPTNGIKNYNIDICATSEEQAQTSFNDIYDMLENNKTKMRKHFSWTKSEIRNLKTGSVIRYRTSNSKTKDGGRPGKVDFDEYHAYENYKLIDVFKTGLGKKAQPRTTIISTMGDVRDGPLDNLMDDMLAILNGTVPDNGRICFICRLDDKGEVNNEENWYKANPSLQYFPNLLLQIRKEYGEWLKDNLGNASFMTKRMNVPQGTTEVPVTEWVNILSTRREVIDLTGQPSVFGVDYMKTTDFLAVGLLFAVDNYKYWLTHSWICENCRDLSRIKYPIKDAAAHKLLTIVPGVEIPPEIPAEWLSEKMKDYRIVAGGLDNYRYSLLKKPLQSIGFDCDKNGNNNLNLVRPSDIMKVAPIISSDFANQRIIWGENSLMRWYTNNVKVVYDNKGNMLYGKIEPKTRKTDGFMALAAAYTVGDKLKELAPLSSKITDLIGVYTFQ